jgi:hypothetical protein
MLATTPFDRLGLPLARQVDRICDRVEQAWVAGERPRIEDALAEVPAEARPALLWELVRLEVCYRQQRGEAPTPGEYHARFPPGAELPEWGGP